MASNTNDHSNDTPLSFRVVTFNVMFEREPSVEREVALVDQLVQLSTQSSTPVVIMLQEVSWGLAAKITFALRSTHKTSEISFGEQSMG